MKKIFRFCLTVIALISLYGCSKENDFVCEEISISDNNTQIKVSVESGELSRTFVTDDNRVLWNDNDQIGIITSSSKKNIPFTYLKTSEDGKAVFVGNMPAGEKPLMAYYPYTETASLYNDTKFSFLIPKERDYDGRSNGQMMALPENDGSFVFKHLGGLVKVTINNIPEGAVYFTVSSPKLDKVLCGGYKVDDIHVENPVMVANNFGDNNEILFKLPEGCAGSSKTFYIPLAAYKFSQLRFALKNADKRELWYKIVSNCDVKRGVITSMPEINELKPVVVITSHTNNQVINGYGAIQKILLKGYIENYTHFTGSITLQTEENRTIIYDGYWNKGLPHGYYYYKRKMFELEVELHSGVNRYTINKKGEYASGQECTEKEEFILIYDENNEPAEAVDLGLPSGNKWASRNLGAEKPADEGYKYVWGDNTGTDTHYRDDYSDIKYGQHNISGVVAYDPVANLWGNGWVMPTINDFKELMGNTDSRIEEIDGKQVTRYVSKINGNSIVVPYDCKLWTSENGYDQFGFYPDRAFYFPAQEMEFRHIAQSIRPVYKEN